MLYLLLFSTHPKGFGKPTVHAIPSTGFTGHLDENGKLVTPDMIAVREALPHYLRKSFDRTPCTSFNSRDNNLPAHKTLYSTRGKYLNTLYFQPLNV